METFKFPINSFSPIDEQIYIQLKKLILENKLLDMKELPVPRDLAIFLKQSQADVASAYKQLEIEGYIKRKDSVFSLSALEIEEAETDYTSPFVIKEEHYQYDFLPHIVDQKHFPLERWNECLFEASQDGRIFVESQPNGEDFLREVLVNHLFQHRKLKVSPANIFIGSSIQTLLASLALFLIKKDYYSTFIIENPGNPKSYNIFKSLGYNISTYRVTPDGHYIDEIPEERAVLYLTPSQQQPLGITLPVEQRFNLIAWAKRNNSLIIEDDNDSEFRYNGRSITPMATMNSEHVVYMGSFSRSFLPSLHVAYLVLPDRYVEEFTHYIHDTEQSSSAVAQIAIAKFIQKGYLNEHLKKMSAIYEQKMVVLATKISTTFPSSVIIYSDESGQSLLIQPNNDMTEEELIESARKKSVKVYPSSPYFLEDRVAPGPIIVLGFGRMTRTEIITGIERLASAWFDTTF